MFNMKNHLGIGIAAVAVVIASWILGYAFMHRNQSDNTIAVTGLGEKDFVADLIVWNGSFSRKSTDLQAAYSQLDSDRQQITQYLQSKGIDSKEMVFSAVDIQKQFDENYNSETGVRTSTFTGYDLSQTVSIESKNVAKVEELSRQVTELINKGIEFESRAPNYYYTKLADLKKQMISDATKDARERAQNIAEKADADLGKLKKASMGVIQITGKNSAEDYSWGGAFNTTSKEKTASITIKLEYEVD